MKIDARPLFSLTKKSRFARIDNVFINMQIHNTQRCQSGLTPKPSSLLSGTPRIFDRSTSKKNAEVSERPNVHAWKACVVKATSGSNPDLCAK